MPTKSDMIIDAKSRYRDTHPKPAPAPQPAVPTNQRELPAPSKENMMNDTTTKMTDAPVEDTTGADTQAFAVAPDGEVTHYNIVQRIFGWVKKQYDKVKGLLAARKARHAARKQARAELKKLVEANIVALKAASRAAREQNKANRQAKRAAKLAERQTAETEDAAEEQVEEPKRAARVRGSQAKTAQTVNA